MTSYFMKNCIISWAVLLLSPNNHLFEVLDHNLRSKISINCSWTLMEPLDHWSIQVVERVSYYAVHPSSVCCNERMNWPKLYMEELTGVLVFWRRAHTLSLTHSILDL